VIDRRTRKVVATLEDERGLFVHSERMIEVQFIGRDPIRAGNQSGTPFTTTAFRLTAVQRK